MTESLLLFTRRILPAQLRCWLGKQQRSFRCWPPVGWVRFGDLRRVIPVSRVFGSDRGECIDRYYIDTFLARYATDIRGSVLEVADNVYTMRYGGDHVTRSDVLHVQDGNPRATIVADLTAGECIPPDQFDCIIITQTLQF